jgi:thiol-disulfide isomerase/thioredoxin
LAFLATATIMRNKHTLLEVAIFLLSTVITIFTIMVGDGFIVDSMGLPKGIGLLLAFGSFFLLYAGSVLWCGDTLSLKTITTVILMPPLMILGIKGLTSSYKYFLKQAPFYLAVIFGLLAAYFYSIQSPKKISAPVLLGLFPLLMSIGVYDLWVHKIEYGSFTGSVVPEQMPPIEFYNKEGQLVSNASFQDKYVIFDFWYIGCRPCWVKFPQLEKLYEKYQTNEQVEIFAVNRPMSYDKPGALFSRIEEKGYTFPVLQGTQKVMDDLEIYVYPTVILLDKEGQVVFRGKIEAAGEKLFQLLGA